MNNGQNLIQNWGEGLGESFRTVGVGVANFVPKLIIAIVVFIAGWVVASVLGRVVAQIIRSMKVDNILKSAGVEDLLQRGGFRLDSGAFLGTLVKWFIIVVFLVASLDIIGLTEVNEFLREVVLTYLPNVIAAVLILLVGAVIADVMQKLVTGSAKAAEISVAPFLGGVTRWAIWVLAIVIALDKLGILSNYGTILFQGIVYFLVIAGGLAFGLGGKEAAGRFLENLRQDISSQNQKK